VQATGDWTKSGRVIVAVGAFAAAIGASLVAHLWFEKPLERRLRGPRLPLVDDPDAADVRRVGATRENGGAGLGPDSPSGEPERDRPAVDVT
jgi:hypothetical protein